MAELDYLFKGNKDQEPGKLDNLFEDETENLDYLFDSNLDYAVDPNSPYTSLMENNTISVYSEDERNVLRDQGPIGIGEAFQRQNKLELIPFSPAGLIDAFSVKNAVERLQKDEYGEDWLAKQKDEQSILQYMRALEEEQIRGFSWGGNVYRIASQMPAFMVEFWASGGGVALAKKGIQKTATTALKGAAKVGAGKAARGMAFRATKYAGEVAARTPIMYNLYGTKYAENQIFANIALTDKGVHILEAPQESKWTSFAKAYGDAFIEVGSEMLGQKIFKPGGAGLKRSISSQLSPQARKGMEKFMKFVSADGKITRAFTKGGFDGIIEEIGEEIVGDQLRAAFGLEDFGADDPTSIIDRMRAAVPGWDDVSVMAGAFAIPGVTSYSADKLYKKLRKRGVDKAEAQNILNNLSQTEKEKMLQDFLGEENQWLSSAVHKALAGEKLTPEEQHGLNEKFYEYMDKGDIAIPDATKKEEISEADKAKAIQAAATVQGALSYFQEQNEAFKSNLLVVAHTQLPEEVPADKAISILKKSGLTKEELDYTGIIPHLHTKTKWTRKEITDFIDAHKVKVEITTKSDKRIQLNTDSKYATPVIMAHLNRAIESEPDMDLDGLALWIANTSEIYNELNKKFPGLTEQEGWEDTIIEDLVPDNFKVGKTRWGTGNLVLPGGEDYMEILVTLPNRQVMKQREIGKQLKDIKKQYKALQIKVGDRVGKTPGQVNLHNYFDEEKLNEEELAEFNRIRKEELALEKESDIVAGAYQTPRDLLGGDPRITLTEDYDPQQPERIELENRGVVKVYEYPDGEVIEQLGNGNYVAITVHGARFENPVLQDVEQWLVRELDLSAQLTGKTTADDYTHPHWEEKNILFHIRLNFREDTDGNKVLFIEELQSDWHKAARKTRSAEIKRLMKEEGLSKEEAAQKVPKSFGYRGDVEADLVAKRKALQKRRGEIIDRGSLMLEDEGTTLGIKGEDKAELDRINEELANLPDAAYKADDLVPDAPFKDSWQELGIKKAIEIAVANGATKVAWIDGEQSADRYNLWTYYDYVNYKKNPDGTYYMYAKQKDEYGSSGTEKYGLTEAELIEYIGQDNFDRVEKQEGEENATETEKVIVKRGKPVGAFQKHYTMEETKEGKLIIVQKLVSGLTKRITKADPKMVKVYRVVNPTAPGMVVEDFANRAAAESFIGSAVHLKIKEISVPIEDTEKANVGRTYEKSEKKELQEKIKNLNSSWYIKFESGKELGTYVSKESAEKEAAGMLYDYWENPMRQLDVKGYRKGGEKHINFYDKMLPRIVNNYIKKWGSKVEMIEIPGIEDYISQEEAKKLADEGDVAIYADTPDGGNYQMMSGDDVESAPHAKFYIEKESGAGRKQMGFEITPMMKIEVSEVGQPLFGHKLAAGVTGEAIDIPQLVEEILMEEPAEPAPAKPEAKETREQKYLAMASRISEIMRSKADLKEKKAQIKETFDYFAAERKRHKASIKRYKDGYLDEEYNELPKYYRSTKGETLDSAATEAGMEGDMEFRDYLIRLESDYQSAKEAVDEINAQIREFNEKTAIMTELKDLKTRLSAYKAGKQQGIKELSDIRKEATKAARKLLPASGKRYFNKILTAINSMKKPSDIDAAIEKIEANYLDYLDRVKRAKAVKQILKRYKKPQNILDVKYREKVQTMLNELGEKRPEQRKALQAMTTEELVTTARRVARLIDAGKLSKAKKDEMKQMASEIMRGAAIQAAGGRIDIEMIGSVEEIKKAGLNPLKREALKWKYGFARPLRMIRSIFGKFGERMFYDSVEQAETIAQHEKIKRLNQIDAVLKRLGVKRFDLGKTVTIDGATFQVNNIMTMYAQEKNKEGRAAIIHGNKISEETYEKLIAYLKKEYPAAYEAVDEIKKIVGARKKEIANVMADSFNIAMKFVDDYFPIARARFSRKEEKDPDAIMGMDIVGEAVMKKGHGVNYTAVEKGLTISRQQIADHNQLPISLNFMEDAARAIDNQEHLIHFAGIQKMYNNVKTDKDLRDAVIYNHGMQAWESFDRWMNEAINPRMAYQGLGFWGTRAKQARRSLGVFYLGFNVITAMKQFPSAHLALKYTSFGQLYQSMAKVLFNKEAQKRIMELDPSIQHRIVEREIGEIMQGASKLNQNDFMRQAQIAEQWLGEKSMKMILNMDRWAVMSVFDAVYNSNVDRLGHEGAVKLAHKALLETQPQGRRIDLPEEYRTNDQFWRMVLMFTNQLNQIYNMMAFDAPAEFKRGEKGKMMMGIASIMLSNIMIYGASHGGFDWPEDDEDQWKAWVELTLGSAISSIPVAGNLAMSMVRGYAPQLLTAQSVIDNYKWNAQKFQNEEYAQAVFDIMIDTMVLAGVKIPYNAVKRSIRGIQDISEGETDDIRRSIWSKSALYE